MKGRCALNNEDETTEFAEPVNRLISLYQEHLDSRDELSAIGYFHMQAVFCEQNDYEKMGQLYGEFLREMVKRGIPFDTASFEREETVH